MESPIGTGTNATSPAVLFISSVIWRIIGVLGTLWSLLRLLLVMVMGGMVGPETYLATLALYLASGAAFVGCIVFAGFLGRGRRTGRLVLSAYVVILPGLLFYPYLIGGQPADGGMPSAGTPWREALLSPGGAAVLLAVAATVLMWLPPASAYMARVGARTPEAPDGPAAAPDRAPTAATAAVWVLAISGVVAALEAVLGLLLLTESFGSAAKTTPALVLYLTLAALAVGSLACAWAIRRGRPAVRPVLTVISLAGLILVLLATVAAYSNVSAGGPWAAAGLPAVILMTVFSQGLPVIGALAAAVLVWLPSARRHFRRGVEAVPAGKPIS